MIQLTSPDHFGRAVTSSVPATRLRTSTVRQAARRVPVRSSARTASDIHEGALGAHSLSDEQIVAQLQRGCFSGFFILVERYEMRALGTAMRLVRNEWDARDIVQEAFLRVYRRASRFEGSASFSTWLHSIVHNLAVDLLRRPYRGRASFEQAESLAHHSHSLSNWPECALCPDEAFGRLELSATIANAIELLPPIHREVVILREILGLSYDEMALRVGCARGTIMSRLFHARQRLQYLLRDVYEEQFCDGREDCEPAPGARRGRTNFGASDLSD